MKLRFRWWICTLAVAVLLSGGTGATLLVLMLAPVAIAQTSPKQPTEPSGKPKKEPFSPGIPLEYYFDYLKGESFVKRVLRQGCIDPRDRDKALDWAKKEITWLLRYSKTYAKTHQEELDAKLLADLLYEKYSELQKKKICPPGALQPTGPSGTPSETPPPKCITKEDIDAQQDKLDEAEAELVVLNGVINHEKDWINHLDKRISETADEPNKQADFKTAKHQAELELPRMENERAQLLIRLSGLRQTVEDLKERFKKQQCAKQEGGGGGIPKEQTGGGGEAPKKEHPKRALGRPLSENITLTGTDGETWCTYGDGVGIETTLIPTDENGVPIEITTAEETTMSEAPSGETTAPEPPKPPEEPNTSSEPAPEAPMVTEEAPTTPATPKSPEEAITPSEPTAETPKVTEKEPEQPPTIPETPQVTESLPPETPEVTEQPPEEPPTSPIPDTIFVKAKESVLEGQPTGSPIENQVVKLFPPEEPDLPGTGGTKEAEDTGFDKDPVECTTGADGDCKMQVPVEERAVYDLPSGEKPGKNYRVDYDLPKDSGGVAETTGKPAEPDVKTGTPAGAEVTYEQFKIGDRTFVRLVYEQPYGLDHDFDEQFKPIFGDSYEEDYCRDKQPGPPLGMQPSSFSALNHDLPEADIKFGAVIPAQGDAR